MTSAFSSSSCALSNGAVGIALACVIAEIAGCCAPVTCGCSESPKRRDSSLSLVLICCSCVFVICSDIIIIIDALTRSFIVTCDPHLKTRLVSLVGIVSQSVGTCGVKLGEFKRLPHLSQLKAGRVRTSQVLPQLSQLEMGTSWDRPNSPTTLPFCPM